jgi:uncharacterized spore protein YtfJ
MDPQDLLAQARDAMTVKRVFGEPIEKDGVTVIPVATVIGGAGGGSGTSTEAGGEGQGGGPSGTGGGYGLRATPAGVYVIQDGTVRWEPALDLNRVILGGQLVAIVLFLTIRAIARARAAGSRD